MTHRPPGGSKGQRLSGGRGRRSLLPELLNQVSGGRRDGDAGAWRYLSLATSPHCQHGLWIPSQFPNVAKPWSLVHKL